MSQFEDSGPGRMARPYALTKGRTRTDADLPIEALVITSTHGRSTASALPREQRSIATMCSTPLSLAEISAHLHVPLGVARVLVGDMSSQGLVDVHRRQADATRPDIRLLERVLDGIRAI